MAQIISVKLTRFDGSPWGFRLQGGKDFAQPLCIQKVNGGSPAEKAGLQAGDTIVKLNETELYSLRHKEAQDAIVRAGNSFEITIQRGGETWKPAILPVGKMPKPQAAPAPNVQMNNFVAPVTKTSLAKTQPDPAPIGTGHNNIVRPFAPQMNGGHGQEAVKSIVNKQYNTPVGIYSEENIAETLSAQAEVLAGGVLGVNFKKNEKTYQPNNSEVLRMVQEVDLGPREAEPEDPAFAPVAGLRRVAAPEMRPVPTAAAAQNNIKSQLPPGQNICSACERLIVGVFVRIKEKNLHVECFKCATCGSSLKNVGYYNIGTKLYCDVHAKQAARQQPHAPNLEPVTVPPGQRPPPNTITASLAAAANNVQSPTPIASAFPPQPSAMSPQATNMAPLPFHNPTPPSSAPISSAPKPFFAPPPPTVSSAAMNKPAGGPKFVWPPPRPEEIDPMITGPTATPIYINPMEPTIMERPPPPPPPVVLADHQGRPTIIAPVKPPIQITPAPVEHGPPVHPHFRPPTMPDRPVSPMVYALTTACDQPYTIRASPILGQQKKVSPLVAQQQAPLPNFQPSFDVPPQPYQHQQFYAPKAVQPVQPPKMAVSQQQFSQQQQFAAQSQQQYAAQSQQQFAAQTQQTSAVSQSQQFSSQQSSQQITQQITKSTQQFSAQSTQQFASETQQFSSQPQQIAPPPLPPAFKPASPPLIPADKPSVLVSVPDPLTRQASPPILSPFPILPRQPSPAPPQVNYIPAPQTQARAPSPLPALTTIPARQTFPPPAPILNKALGSALAAATKAAALAPAPAVTSPAPPAPGPGAGAAPGGPGGNPKSGVAGSTAPRRGRGVLTAPVSGSTRVPLCGMCQGQIRGPFITAMGKTWCPDHFICVNSQCQRALQDCGFVEEKGELYCEFCFEQFLAPPCDKCHKKIKGDCLNAIGKHFHPECFVCAYCSKLFANNPFFLEDGLPYCEADWNELFTTKCFACGFPIEAGDRWVEALNNNYHSQCFNCTMCKKNLEGQSFFAKQGRPFCKTHAR